MNIQPLLCRIWGAGLGLIEGSRPYSTGKQIRKDAGMRFRANSCIAHQKKASYYGAINAGIENGRN
jgi:hypothetical protein